MKFINKIFFKLIKIKSKKKESVRNQHNVFKFINIKDF